MVPLKRPNQPIENDPGAPSFDRCVDDKYAAEVLGVSVALVRFWRCKKKGPRYRKIGRRVVYTLSDLYAFIKSLPAGGAKVAK